MKKGNDLTKLANLCEKCNARYARGLNDDDQVRAMFDYANISPDLCLLIGWDKYKAATVQQVQQSENVTQDEKGNKVVWMYGDRYRVRYITKEN